MKATAWRHTLLIALAVLCQGVLAVHDAQHVDAQPTTCSVCQAHSPQISGEPPGILVPEPLALVAAPAPRQSLTRAVERPYATFQPRAPPMNLP